MSRIVVLLLLAVHFGLLLWALVGLLEWFAPTVPWPRVSNTAFPRWLLLLHWLAVMNSAATFLAGYLRRWAGTPRAMMLGYSVMAAVCVVETFWFLSGHGRFVAMALEFAAYIGISVLLLRMPGFTARFAQPESANATQ